MMHYSCNSLAILMQIRNTFCKFARERNETHSMRESENVNNLVVIGAWNTAIFTPEWVAQNLIEGDFTAQVPLNGIGSLKFSTPEFSFVIIQNRLCFQLLQHTSEANRKTVSVLRKLLQCLQHTPISALGANFVFLVDNMPADLAPIDSTPAIMEATQSELTFCSVKRGFKLREKETLYLEVTSAAEKKFDFNYHFDISRVIDALSILGDDDDFLNNKRSSAIALMNQVYGESI